MVQLLWYDARVAGEEDWTTVVVSESLRLRDDYVFAIAPFFGEERDRKLQSAVRDMVQYLEGGIFDEYRLIDPYHNYIFSKLHQGSDIEPALTAHLFRRFPGRALGSFAEAYFQGDGAEKQKSFSGLGTSLTTPSGNGVMVLSPLNNPMKLQANN